ncbi:hypothetical protein HDU91_002791 [Kappamyces sp. JEL0680]|nr:hypothetical protein HDU91_002791 [Kappamyces sp. JEL0680]
MGTFEPERWNIKDGRMHFGNGQKCWNGPERSVTVQLFCSPDEKIISIAEPNMCEYFMEGISRGARMNYRANRNRDYISDMPRGTSIPLDTIKPDVLIPRPSIDNFYEVEFDSTDIVTYSHPQLRHMLACTGNDTIVYSNNNLVQYYNSITRKRTSLIDFYADRKSFKATSIAANEQAVCVGGRDSELAIKTWDSPSAPLYKILSSNDNASTNYLELSGGRSGALTCFCCNNDNAVRLLDVHQGRQIECFSFGWAPNCLALSPDQRLMCVVGDSTDAVVVESATGKPIYHLTGHIDYSFACDWSPNSRLIATGSQDCTMRLYDIRNPSKSLVTLPSNLSSVRSIAFDHTGTFMHYSESADYVHVLDPRRFDEVQSIDFIGDIAGVSWNSSGDDLFIGVCHSQVGGILHSRKRDWVRELCI